MSVTIATNAVERSTYVISVVFKDEDGNEVTPTAATWSLLSDDGEIVNGRDAEAVSPLAATADIVLTDDDLNFATGKNGKRRLLLEATYDSGYGSDLSLREEAEFFITDLIGV